MAIQFKIDERTYFHIKGVFGGSGSAAMGYPAIQRRILKMTNKPVSEILVIYLGTATYDKLTNEQMQTGTFRADGAKVVAVRVATQPATAEELSLFAEADVIMVSGGNTLFALDRWVACGLDQAIRAASQRGAVLAGGSAGAICWFDGGHSDSMDPTTYLRSNGQEERRDWEYIRVDGLGIMPGLLCPHHDRTQSNGLPRASDFDAMLKRHSGERGIGIDHWAVWAIEEGRYEVISVEEDSHVCIKEVDEQGTVTTFILPSSGHLHDVLRPASIIVHDHRLAIARAENPSNELSH